MDTPTAEQTTNLPAITVATIPPVVVECQELRATLAANTYKLGLMAAVLGLTGQETPAEIIAHCRNITVRPNQVPTEPTENTEEVTTKHTKDTKGEGV